MAFCTLCEMPQGCRPGLWNGALLGPWNMPSLFLDIDIAEVEGVAVVLQLDRTLFQHGLATVPVVFECDVVQ